MTTNFLTKYFAARCRKTLPALAAFALFMGACFTTGPAWSIQLDQPSSAIGADDTSMPITSSPAPVKASEDSCLPLLKSARAFGPAPSAMDRDWRSAKKAAALGVVFGIRFALGPKEVTHSKSRSRVKVGVWQPEDYNGAHALAVADYRRCKNDQALKAISDWRWQR